MKIRITLKDPDTMPDAVKDAYKRAKKPDVDDLTEVEWRAICDDRAATADAAISHKWMQYGEYLTVEYDTQEGSMIVVPMDN